MIRQVYVPLEDKGVTPSDFKSDATRILAKLADDWDSVTCQPMTSNSGPKTYYGPMWIFSKPYMGANLGFSIGMSFYMMEYVAASDPHLNMVRYAMMGGNPMGNTTPGDRQAARLWTQKLEDEKARGPIDRR